MIGAMPAVAVRHERRKKKTKDKENRPKHLLLKAHVNKTLGDNLSPNGSHAPSANPSRAGSPTHQGDLPELGYEVRYGDDCFDGKLSLLHFIVFFFLGGLTVLIVGAVQFKEDAGLTSFRFYFLGIGGILVAVGFLLLVVKCACFRHPLPDEYSDDIDDFLSPQGEKKNGSPKITVTDLKEVNEKDKNHKNDHNHHRQEKLATADQSESMQLTSIAKNKDATKKDTPESTNNKKLSPA